MKNKKEERKGNFTNLSPAHRTGGVPVEPGGHALLAEDVLALQDRWLLKELFLENIPT